MCPTSLYFSCGALPFPEEAGLGLHSCGSLGSWCWCEIPGRSHEWSPCAFWETGPGSRDLRLVSLCCSLHQQRSVPWQQLLIILSVTRCLFHGISVKEQRLLLLYWLCPVLWQTLPSVCLYSVPLGVVSALCVSLLLLEGGGEGSHPSQGIFIFPPVNYCVPCADCPLPAGQSQWFMKRCGHSSRVDLLQPALDSSGSGNHQIFRSFKVPKWICYLSALCCFGGVQAQQMLS